jgi:hypothetical protein
MGVTFILTFVLNPNFIRRIMLIYSTDNLMVILLLIARADY